LVSIGSGVDTIKSRFLGFAFEVATGIFQEVRARPERIIGSSEARLGLD
jgi:hypothetical protein